jgi:hypothetical protein
VRKALLAAAAALLVGRAPPLSAQDLSVRVGGLHARYADSLSGSAGSLAGRLVLDAPRFRLGTTFSVAQFTSGHWAAQFGASGLSLQAVGGSEWLSAGILAQGYGSWLEGGSLSGVATGGPVLVAATGPWVAWVAGEAGGLRRIDGGSSGLVGATVHVRRDVGEILGLDAAASADAAGAVRYQEFTVGVDGRVGALSGGLTYGARSGGLGGGPWAQARAAWRVFPCIALEFEGGKYPADITGFTHGLFVTAGVRVGLTRAALEPRRGRSRAAGDALRVERLDRDQVRVVFRVPGARSVALAGEWNDWTPEPLRARDDGRWDTVVRLAPGAYRFSLVVDGEQWTVPSGVPTLPDDFGGQVGLLVVRR